VIKRFIIAFVLVLIGGGIVGSICSATTRSSSISPP